jgi:hypothetical protein
MPFIIAIFIAAIALLAGCQKLGVGATSTEPAIKFEPTWLPKSAQLVYSSEDETIKVRARVTETEFIGVAKTLQLVPYAEDKEFGEKMDKLRWNAGPDKLWNPSPKPEGTLICHRAILWELVKYENGFLYYEMFNLDR